MEIRKIKSCYGQESMAKKKSKQTTVKSKPIVTKHKAYYIYAPVVNTVTTGIAKDRSKRAEYDKAISEMINCNP